MSTLGRKAMKRTLERLRERALQEGYSHTKELEAFRKFLDGLDELEQRFLRHYDICAHEAMLSMIMYIQALEDYGYELDEAWDKLLESAREHKESETTQKEPSYRV